MKLTLLLVILLSTTSTTQQQPSESWLQGKSHAADNTTHWQHVEDRLSQVANKAASLQSLLAIDADYHTARDEFDHVLKGNPIAELALKLAADPTLIELSEGAGVDTSRTLMWPCTCGDETCKCTMTCEECQEASDAAASGSLLTSLEQKRIRESASDQQQQQQQKQQQPLRFQNHLPIDAEADWDLSNNKNNNNNGRLVRGQGEGSTPELAYAAMLLQLQSKSRDVNEEEGEEEAISGEGGPLDMECSCETECLCAKDCTCANPTFDKEHCKAGHAALLQCDLVCLPLFPWDLICGIFTSCATKCKIEGVEGFPKALKQVCDMVCGCKKYCVVDA